MEKRRGGGRGERFGRDRRRRVDEDERRSRARVAVRPDSKPAAVAEFNRGRLERASAPLLGLTNRIATEQHPDEQRPPHDREGDARARPRESEHDADQGKRAADAATAHVDRTAQRKRPEQQPERERAREDRHGPEDTRAQGRAPLEPGAVGRVEVGCCVGHLKSRPSAA
ncbi:MAG: hypothetical protein LW636_04190 [Planctomycetaceae bacterium]|nr:hypothetical protein [Planctomycetaceae bacterium]